MMVLFLPHSVIVPVHISVYIPIHTSAISTHATTVTMTTIVVITADGRRIIWMIHIVNIVHDERWIIVWIRLIVKLWFAHPTVTVTVDIALIPFAVRRKQFPHESSLYEFYFRFYKYKFLNTFINYLFLPRLKCIEPCIIIWAQLLHWHRCFGICWFPWYPAIASQFDQVT